MMISILATDVRRDGETDNIDALRRLGVASGALIMKPKGCKMFNYVMFSARLTDAQTTQ